MTGPAKRADGGMQTASAGVRSIARNTTALAAAQVVGIAARMAYVVLVARLLGPELYALLAYSQAWYLAFLPIAMYGRGIVVHSIAREPQNAAQITAQSTAIRFTASTVAAVACAGLAWLLPGSRDAAPLVTVLVLALTGRALSIAAQDLFAAFEVTHHTLRQEALFRGLEVCAAAMVLLSGGGLLLLVATHGLVWWLQAARSLYIVRRDLVPLRVAWRPGEWLPVARAAQPFFWLSLAAGWRQDGPLILYRNLADSDALFGQFALAMQAFMLCAGLAQSLASASQPVVTRSAQRADGKDLVYAGMVLRLAFLGGGLLGLVGLGLGPWLFRTVFGARYATAGDLVGPALWCLTPMLAGIALPAVIMARGHFRVGTLAMMASAVVTTVALPLLAGPFGAWGAVAGVALGYAVLPLIASLYAASQGWRLAGGVVLRPLGAVTVAALAYFALAGVSPWLALLVAVAALTGSAWRLGVVSRDELRVLRSILPQGRPGQPAE
jgi:O-antigen/teichoic acid export membrane protein